jgi:hypothetical protein
MTEAVFRLDEETVHAADLARGPWDPGAQHGGAPAALLARLIERAAAPQTVRRVTVELLRPVPLGELKWQVQGRAGRSVGRWTASLAAGGREVARAQGLTCRTATLEAEMPRDERRLPPPTDGALRIPGMPDQRSFYYTAMEARLATGTVSAPGPAAVWFRLTCPLIEGERPTPLVRAVAAADSASGTSWVLPFGPFLYVNADLTVALHRLPRGDWIGVDAATTVDRPSGVGLTETGLYDQEGHIGTAQQVLLVSAA